MKRLLLSASLLPFLTAPGEEITYGLGEGDVLTRTFEAHAEDD